MCSISTKLGTCRLVLTKVSNTIFHVNPHSESLVEPHKPTFITIIIIIIIINCCWVVTRWQWLFYMYTKYEIGY